MLCTLDLALVAVCNAVNPKTLIDTKLCKLMCFHQTEKAAWWHNTSSRN